MLDRPTAVKAELILEATYGGRQRGAVGGRGEGGGVDDVGQTHGSEGGADLGGNL